MIGANFGATTGVWPAASCAAIGPAPGQAWMQNLYTTVSWTAPTCASIVISQ